MANAVALKSADLGPRIRLRDCCFAVSIASSLCRGNTLQISKLKYISWCCVGVTYKPVILLSCATNLRMMCCGSIWSWFMQSAWLCLLGLLLWCELRMLGSRSNPSISHQSGPRALSGPSGWDAWRQHLTVLLIVPFNWQCCAACFGAKASLLRRHNKMRERSVQATH